VRLPGIGGLPNRNELVRRDSTVVGVKTGFTEASGYGLVAAAEREGRLLLAVVLDSADAEARFDDAARLLDHAEQFASLPVLGPVELGCAGREVVLQPAATTVVVPEATRDLVEVAWPPRTSSSASGWSCPRTSPSCCSRRPTGTRYLPIWIGAVEATAIAFALQGVETPRPLTHDLFVGRARGSA
jgi:D-alanyl-D-alanine carboxypeptidase